jgi:putative heme transporter
VVGGIAGGLLAVPLLAVLNAGIRSLLHDPPLAPTEVDALARHAAQAAEPEPDAEPPNDHADRPDDPGGDAGVSELASEPSATSERASESSA